MTLMVILAVIGGILLGKFLIPEELTTYTSEFVTMMLALMVFNVGIDIGRNKESFKEMKKIGFKILAVPLAIGFGTLAGASLAAILLSMPLTDSMAVGAGFGWYSLSGVIITQIHSAELGTVAFLANVFRELMAFLMIPILIGYVGKVAAIAPGGATTMDSTLPLITKVTDSQTGLIAFMSGLVLTSAVPIIVPLILSL